MPSTNNSTRPKTSNSNKKNQKWRRGSLLSSSLPSAAVNGRSGASSPDDDIPRNSKGGVLVTEDEMKAALLFFDTDCTGSITASNLRERMAAFNDNITAKELKLLMDGKEGLTLKDLKSLLMENEVTNFDPFGEGFALFDPKGTGFVDTGALRKVFKNLGYGEIDEEELHVLIGFADKDGDGKVSVEDFRNILVSPEVSGEKEEGSLERIDVTTK